MDSQLKTELSLAAIFRHCQEVQDGKRQPIATKQAEEWARTWLGKKKEMQNK